jgi:hypothetical protein
MTLKTTSSTMSKVASTRFLGEVGREIPAEKDEQHEPDEKG